MRNCPEGLGINTLPAELKQFMVYSYQALFMADFSSIDGESVTIIWAVAYEEAFKYQ